MSVPQYYGDCDRVFSDLFVGRDVSVLDERDNDR